jgi:hypothetical protein
VAYETISAGITLTIPTAGTVNWAATVKSGAWQKISEHDHTGSGKGLKIGPSSISANSLDKTAISKNLGEYQITVSPTGAAQAINWNDGRRYVVSMASSTVDVAITLSNPVEGADYLIKLVNHLTNKISFTNGNIKWPQGVNPSGATYYLTQATGAIDVIQFYYDGTNYLASWDVDLS